MSRRARGVELWAALRSLGRAGSRISIERTCGHAQRFAEGLRAPASTILNDVVINQVLVSFGAPTEREPSSTHVQRDGTCWCGGTEWHGRAAMRISVSSWATTAEDVEPEPRRHRSRDDRRTRSRRSDGCDAHAGQCARQPNGAALPGWTPPPLPPRDPMTGRYVRVEPIDERFAADLHAANLHDVDGRNWTYLPVRSVSRTKQITGTGWRRRASARTRCSTCLSIARPAVRWAWPPTCASPRPLASSRLATFTSRRCCSAPRGATEAMYLMMQRAFALGYRRYEWKCDALNAPSRAAAVRLGFSFEGIFRQADDLQRKKPRYRVVLGDRFGLARPGARVRGLACSVKFRRGRTPAIEAERPDTAPPGKSSVTHFQSRFFTRRGRAALSGPPAFSRHHVCSSLRHEPPATASNPGFRLCGTTRLLPHSVHVPAHSLVRTGGLCVPHYLRANAYIEGLWVRTSYVLPDARPPALSRRGTQS